MTIGVLALQGDFKEHIDTLKKCSVKTLEVRTPEDLEQVQGLIIPGGESTTIRKLLKSSKLDQAIIKRAKQGMPIFGTCAGLIVLAQNLKPAEAQSGLKLLDVTVERNSYGRQLDSFTTKLDIQNIDKQIPAYFIRAPRITRIGTNIEVLAHFQKDPVLIQEGNILAATFHPELSENLKIHWYFIGLIK